MNCLVISSTIFEIKPFVEYCRNSNKLEHLDLQLDFVIGGVGQVNTTYALMKYLQLKRPDVVVMAGIAGSFTSKLQLGDVVVVKDEAMADLGVQEKDGYKDVFDLNLVAPNQSPFSKKKLINPSSEYLKRTKLKKVSGVTVNQVTSSKKTAELYQSKYKAAIESMEGAALHFVCIKENIPFLQIRSISNYVGERNKKKWKIKEAIEQLNIELTRFVESL